MRKLWLTPEIKGLNFTQDEVNNAINSDMPLLLTLYTSAICNAKCPSCFITNDDPNYPELTILEQIKIIQGAAQMGVKTIKISGAGEPLIVPSILRLIEECERNSIIPVIYTNGSSLGNNSLCRNIYKMNSFDLIDYLWGKNCSLVYKCNSFLSERQDYLLGVNGLSTVTYKGLLNLLYKNYNRNHRLALQTIITPYNYDEVESLYRFARKNNITPYFETVLKKGNAQQNNCLYLANGEIQEIFLRLCEIDKQEFEIQWFPVPSYVGFQCTELGYALLIDNFGYARYCPGIWENIANIHELSLDRIWESDAAREFRDRIKNPMGGKCGDCAYKRNGMCGYGCRAYSYLNEGDMFAEYKECWW